jgi:hypothetical protein
MWVYPDFPTIFALFLGFYQSNSVDGVFGGFFFFIYKLLLIAPQATSSIASPVTA